VRAYAESLAHRVRLKPDVPIGDAVKSAYLLTFSRPPTSSETADSLIFLKQQGDSYRQNGKPDPEQLAMTDFCQALFGLNEFVYVE
jgi:hypothetical protein